MLRRSRIILLAFLVVSLLLAGCGGQSLPYHLASEAGMPDYVHAAPEHAREAYRFVVANAHEAEKYPCYCGCVNIGHDSLRGCFVKKIDAAGAVTYDNHAAGCGICVDIAQDVMRLLRDGKSSPEIRAFIDEQYKSSGPPTNTPLPVA